MSIFSLQRNYLSLEKGRSFIWTNLNPLYLSKLCVKFGWNWPSGSREKDENVKFTDGQRDDRRPEKITWNFQLKSQNQHQSR